VLVITCTGGSIVSKGEGQKKGMKESRNKPAKGKFRKGLINFSAIIYGRGEQVL